MDNIPRCHLIRISICLLILLFADITVSFAKTDPQLRQRVWERIEKVLNRYQGCSFNRAIKIGDPAKFQAALNSADIEIAMVKLMKGGKKKGSQGKAVPPGKYSKAKLLIMRDPLDVYPEPNSIKDYDFTMYHETIHLIEYMNGDRDGSVNWNERHAEYFEGLLYRLDNLKKIEGKSRNSAVSDEELIQNWVTFKRRFKRGQSGINNTYPHPPDLAMFERWSGTKIKISDVEKHYRSGAGGSRMKKIVESAIITGISINQIRVKVLPRNISDNMTRFKVTFSFTILAEPGHMNWRGTVGRFVRIQLPQSKSKKPKIIKDISGSLSKCSPGYNDADLLFSLPDKTPENTYDMMLRLDVYGKQDLKWQKITLKYPPVKFSISGPKQVEDGDTCKAKANITSGVPPFKWEWSGSGAHGKGSATAFDMVVNKAPTPNITYTVKVWDKIRSANPKKGPVVKTFTVKVKKKPKDLKISIKYPKESAVGRVIDIIPTITGGKGKFRYEWTTISGRVVRKKDIRGKFRSPGNKTISLRVWDDGRYKKTPKKTSITIKVYPKLEGRIIAPKEAISGEQVTIKAKLQGGKKPYKYLWTNPIGRTLTKEALKGTARGKPGEEKQIKLRAKDSLTPPQVIEISAVMKIKQMFADRCKKIVGTWRWFNGQSVNFSFAGNMGTCTASGGNSGMWYCKDPSGKIVIRWKKGGWVDTLTLSSDGRRLHGSNQLGGSVSAKR